MFGVIVVGVDERGFSNGAVEMARHLAASLGEKVVVAHVYPMHSQRPAGPSTYETYDEAKELVDQIVASFKAEEVDAEGVVEPHAGFGLGRKLLEIAQLRGAGLVVVGDHHRSSVVERTFGSFAHEVVHSTKIPVLVVPGTED
jgi:nucleotide-binding universal stress UspA family protein